MKLIFLVFFLCGSLSFAGFIPFIVGGQPALKDELPFQVSLQSSTGRHYCGGSLIAPDAVLTAAHCVEGRVIIKVVGGILNLKDKGESFKVKQVLIHPLRGKTNFQHDYDFAILKLDGAAKAQPIAVSEEIQTCGDSLTSGWGTLSEGSGKVSDVLMKVAVPIVDQDVCMQSYAEVTDTMICAGLPQGGKDSCQGDSGGPLFIRGVNGKPFLIGVVSWGEGCARPKKYGVYGRVSSVYQWIKDNSQ